MDTNQKNLHHFRIMNHYLVAFMTGSKIRSNILSGSKKIMHPSKLSFDEVAESMNNLYLHADPTGIKPLT
jgi:hypothetical protein